jgi:DNA-binding NarL/FixJ family response regulator
MVSGTMRVLIVDDELLAQTALTNILSARSDVEHFDSANDAIEALEKLATEQAVRNVSPDRFA